jgi:hypothetical protein
MGINAIWTGTMLKFSLLAGPLVMLMAALLTLGLAPSNGATGQEDPLLTPGVTNGRTIQQLKAAPPHVSFYANGDVFWSFHRGRINLGSITPEIAIGEAGSSRPLRLSEVAMLEFDSTTQVLKHVYPRQDR